ncbi:hypothetical protein [Flagellimonas flava]|uniref:hypothetical protein n=1 Tax=Flagellimonas flava TaxID=570519 RepID=UPI003D65DE49
MNRLFIIGLLIFCLPVQGQKSSIKIGKHENFFLTINEEETYVVLDKNFKSNTEPIRQETNINLKRNSIDIYLNWVNPLQYKIIFQDSIINDPRIEEIKKYFKENFTGLAGGTSLLKATSSNIRPLDCSNINGQDKVSKLFPEVYNSFPAGSFNAGTDLCKYWQLMYATLNLDLNKEEEKIKKIIKSIYAAKTPSEALQSHSDGIDIIKRLNDSDKEIIARLFYLNQESEAIEDDSMQVLKQKMQNLHQNISSSYDNIKKLVVLLKTYLGQIESSLKKEALDFDNHYRIKTLKLERGNSIELSISISKLELKDDFSVVEKSKIKEHHLLIQKYDFVTPKIATGVFYSSASLNSFGVATNDNDELIVTKNDIDKNTALTGVFLNFNFDIGSQFISPLFQIGVDPTKERPYLCVGGGISIPTNNFAISIGPIWTWNPELNDLDIDDVVDSTSVLEEDLTYEFSTSPRGFYIGFNYSF